MLAAAGAGAGNAQPGTAGGFEYWSLARRGDGFGAITSPVDAAGKGGKIFTDDFTTHAIGVFAAAAREWLLGDAPFTAKLRPEYATFPDYDQLMRRDEWYGRER